MGWWLGLAFGFFVMSVAAIAVRALNYPGYVPRPIVHVLEPFVEPGMAIWWLTIGKAFQAFPSDWAGRAVAALSNTAFWLLVCAIGAALWRGGLRAVRRLRG
jgi:hypothetical protein